MAARGWPSGMRFETHLLQYVHNVGESHPDIYTVCRVLRLHLSIELGILDFERQVSLVCLRRFLRCTPILKDERHVSNHVFLRVLRHKDALELFCVHHFPSSSKLVLNELRVEDAKNPSRMLCRRTVHVLDCLSRQGHCWQSEGGKFGAKENSFTVRQDLLEPLTRNKRRN